ncbi:UbiA prenyltransferase family [Penicillium malachiteum]|nr:UbiA prenyltransferase family [Penicillium malachiteum]
MTISLLDQSITRRGIEQEPEEFKHALPESTEASDISMFIRPISRQSTFMQAKSPRIDTVIHSIGIFWLFTESDLLTFISPVSAFGILGALSGPLLLQSVNEPMFYRSPRVLIYNWSNAFIFALANQRRPESVEEDRLNKPRRPLPSGQMIPLGPRRLLLAALPVILFINFLLGPCVETSLLFTLNWMYNDLGGGDEDFLLRNIIIGIAFGLYNAGSGKMAGGPGSTINNQAAIWIGIISSMVITTMHVQDLKDQKGDRSRGRRTAPIVLGDLVARHTIAIPIAMWSIICPYFWKLSFAGYILTVPLGTYIIWCLYVNKDFKGDRKSWKLRTVWTVLLYILPAVKRISLLDFQPELLRIWNRPSYNAVADCRSPI